jgi:hypothetical protein
MDKGLRALLRSTHSILPSSLSKRAHFIRSIQTLIEAQLLQSRTHSPNCLAQTDRQVCLSHSLLTDSPTRPPFHPLADALAPLLTHSLAHSPTYGLAHSLPPLLTQHSIDHHSQALTVSTSFSLTHSGGSGSDQTNRLCRLERLATLTHAACLGPSRILSARQ